MATGTLTITVSQTNPIVYSTWTAGSYLTGQIVSYTVNSILRQYIAARNNSVSPQAITTADWTIVNASTGAPYTDGGTTTGAGTQTIGASITVTATARTNYSFTGWSDSSGALMSANASYTYTFAATSTIYANFIYTSSLVIFSPTGMRGLSFVKLNDLDFKVGKGCIGLSFEKSDQLDFKNYKGNVGLGFELNAIPFMKRVDPTILSMINTRSWILNLTLTNTGVQDSSLNAIGGYLYDYIEFFSIKQTSIDVTNFFFGLKQSTNKMIFIFNNVEQIIQSVTISSIASTIFKFERTGTTLKYYENGALIYSFVVNSQMTLNSNISSELSIGFNMKGKIALPINLITQPYFDEGEGSLNAYTVNGIGLHKNSGYNLEINPNNLSFFKTIHGYGIGDYLTFNQLIRLTIDYPNNIIANFNNGITVATQNSGALLNNTAYLCTTRGTTNFSSFTNDTVTVNKPFVTNNAGTPTWAGGTVIQQILLIDNLYIVAN